MRARDVFLQSMVDHGVDAVFGNPGTTENSLLLGLADFPQLHYVMTLHEGVAVCAAGSYALASGKPAVANVHVAPGLGNAIGMIYGALKARAPVVITAGQQDTRLRMRDPLLSHDLVAMAQPVCKWAAQAQTADEVGPVMAKAFQIACQYPPGPVFVSLPNNVLEAQTDVPSQVLPQAVPAPARIEELEQLAQTLASAKAPLLMVGDDVATSGANQVLAQLAETLGAGVRTDFLQARLCIATDHPNRLGPMPHAAGAMNNALSDFDVVMMVGGPTLNEIWFDDAQVIPNGITLLQLENHASLAHPVYGAEQLVVGELASSLNALVDLVKASGSAALQKAAHVRNEAFALTREQQVSSFLRYSQEAQGSQERSPMLPAVALRSLADALPDDVVVFDESITAGPVLEQAFTFRTRDDYFAGRGGGIGQGVAGAIGVAAAHPSRTVVAVSGDGSAMYSIQSLWSAAHHKLNIVFVILVNREYRILKHNLDIHRQRFADPSDHPYPHMDLTNPALDFVALAKGQGVPGAVCATPTDIKAAVADALKAEEPGPFLIELLVEGKDA